MNLKRLNNECKTFRDVHETLIVVSDALEVLKRKDLAEMVLDAADEVYYSTELSAQLQEVIKDHCHRMNNKIPTIMYECKDGDLDNMTPFLQVGSDVAITIDGEHFQELLTLLDGDKVMIEKVSKIINKQFCVTLTGDDLELQEEWDACSDKLFDLDYTDKE